MSSQFDIEIDERSFYCDYPGCHKSFTTKFSLQRHKIIHTGVKKFQCPHCGCRFRLPCDLKEHVYTHTKELPYICGVNDCKKAFRHPSDLSIHRRKHPEYKLKSHKRQKIHANKNNGKNN